MATYLITGVAGFIASRVAALLMEQGHTVIGLDNLNTAYDVRLKHWRLDRLRACSNFSFEQVDVADAGALRALPRPAQCDAVINLAARAGVRESTRDPWVYAETNVTGTLNLLELCRWWEVGKFVLASTSSLYGAHNELPYREDADTNRPLSPYAATKKAAEALSHSYHHLYGIDVSILRYFTVYGPAGRPDMSVFRFVQWISEGRPVIMFGDGSQSRDFTYVDDIARGTIAALRPAGFDVFNLGSDRPIELMELVRQVEARTGRQARIEHQPVHRADVPATWADVTRARTLLSWTPTVGYEEGIANAVLWYQQNRDWAKEVVTA